MNDSLSSAPRPGSGFSLVIDLGTTTLVGRLIDQGGGLLAEQKLVNPQREFAADILLRLQLAHEGEGTRLQQCLLDGLRQLISRLLEGAELNPREVSRVAAAGNPGMTYLLRGLPVESLLFPPHRPADTELAILTPSDLDLGLFVPLQLFPAVSGFVGGDLVACLFSLGKVPNGTICIDIGTNGELALWDETRWWVTSAAAGPAFEGGNIGCGMMMDIGAVTEVSLEGDRLRLQVAGGGLPKGLCGSGLASLVATAIEAGLIDQHGRILSAVEAETGLSRYLCETEKGWSICFYRDANRELCLSQEDLRQFQLAKGALRAGLEVLIERAGLLPQEVDRLMVTGALGTALPVDTLKKVAMLPAAMVDKTRFVPNGVLAGLTRYLAESDGSDRLGELLETMQPFPLSGTPSFERRFMASLEF